MNERRDFLKKAGLGAAALTLAASGAQAEQTPKRYKSNLVENIEIKKLGLIGGIGPESTIPYYREIVYGVQKKVGKKYFPNLAIESLNVFDVLNICSHKAYDELEKYMLVALNNLKGAGCDFAAMSGNTPHIIFDRLQAKSPIPLLSIVEATAAQVKKDGVKKIGLLGTIFTMREDFSKKPFAQGGIEVVVPTESEMEYIERKISDELELGVVKPQTRAEFVKIIERMRKEQGIEAFILGCTELPLLFKDEKTPMRAYDMMQIHIKAIVDTIVKA